MAPIPKTTFAVLALAIALAGAGAGVDARTEPGLCPRYNLLDQKYYWNWGKLRPSGGGKCTFPYDKDPDGNTLGSSEYLVIAVPERIVKYGGHLTMETTLSYGTVEYGLFRNEFGYYVAVFAQKQVSEFDDPTRYGVDVFIRWRIDGEEVAHGRYVKSYCLRDGDTFVTGVDLSTGHRVKLFDGSGGGVDGPAPGHVAVVQFS